MKICCPITKITIFNSCDANGDKIVCGLSCDKFLNICFGSLVDFGARLLMAGIFWHSGMLKYAYYLNNDFESVVFLFREEYMLPAPELMAWLSMIAELSLSALLFLGLFTRFAAFGMLAMTAVIAITYPDQAETSFWGLMLGYLIIRGGGKLSLDWLFCNQGIWARFCSDKPKKIKAPKKRSKK